MMRAGTAFDLMCLMSHALLTAGVLLRDPGAFCRDVELAKFEAFLNREQCKGIKALVRGRQQLAYPIKG